MKTLIFRMVASFLIHVALQHHNQYYHNPEITEHRPSESNSHGKGDVFEIREDVPEGKIGQDVSHLTEYFNTIIFDRSTCSTGHYDVRFETIFEYSAPCYGVSEEELLNASSFHISDSARFLISVSIRIIAAISFLFKTLYLARYIRR
ncbi:hypothetical protein CAEBREN_11564 [Caenorhabditis brenneri]|uniref:Uncharacterized protein n=1 Tax=Caenorhabditis brenneri TaxID=135651 RepID=G0M775_CAEBE|nr:hypothetical protein CAEBREN_11564 [Caenorhabditis brenneri]